MDVLEEARVIADPVEHGVAENKLELRLRLCSKQIALDEFETALKTPQIPSSLLEHFSRNIQADHVRFGKLSQQVRRQTAAAAPGIQDSEVVRPGNLPEQLEAPSFLNCGHPVVSFPVPSHIDRSEFSLQVGSEIDLLQAKGLGAYRLCCRSSTMSDIAFVAAPRICPPGARAKVSILFPHRP